MPDTAYSQPQPTDSTLRSYATRMLDCNITIRLFERQLAKEKDIAAMMSPGDTRKVAYEQKLAVLDIAKIKLEELVDFIIIVLEKQIEKPNRALGQSAERVNEKMEGGLKKVGDALDEMRYLMSST